MARVLRWLFVFDTPIGRVPRSYPWRRFMALAVAVVALVIDARLLVAAQHANYPQRAIVAVVSLLLMWLVCRRDRPSLGLTLRTTQGTAWWCRATLATVVAMAALLLVLVGILVLTGSFEPVRLPPEQVRERLMHTCLWAPFVEEALYRLVLAVALAAVLRPGWVILVAGAVFAGLHVLYGNPGPPNLIGGFVLTWAFLRSGSIAVPLLWHSAGHAFVIATQVFAYEAL